MKAKPTTKEQLVYFLYNHISLGTYDKRFIENIVTGYLASLQPVTSNQHALLDKITLRYARQLRKEEIDANEMVSLLWQIKPVESLPSYTEAYIELKEDNIEVRSPFKSDFIKSFKELPNTKWERETKTWYVLASEDTLKKTIEIVQQHYEKVNYCSAIQHILNTVEAYNEAKYWDPTLVKINGSNYILATNSSLDEAIKNIPLDNSLSSIARLVYHGVNISRSAVSSIPNEVTDDDITFALTTEVTIEHDVDAIAQKLRMVNADYVLMRESNALNKNIADRLQTALANDNVKIVTIDRKNKPSLSEIKNADFPVLLGSYSFSTPLSVMFAKVINLTNSNPIDIK